MKKTLAVLGAFAGTAAAADVSLYGVVDTGFAYTCSDKVLGGKTLVDGESRFAMRSGYNSTSRFGLKGEENLGNGLKVGFILGNGFSSDDGALKYDNRPSAVKRASRS